MFITFYCPPPPGTASMLVLILWLAAIIPSSALAVMSQSAEVTTTPQDCRTVIVVELPLGINAFLALAQSEKQFVGSRRLTLHARTLLRTYAFWKFGFCKKSKPPFPICWTKCKFSVLNYTFPRPIQTPQGASHESPGFKTQTFSANCHEAAVLLLNLHNEQLCPVPRKRLAAVFPQSAVSLAQFRTVANQGSFLARCIRRLLRPFANLFPWLPVWKHKRRVSWVNPLLWPLY